MIYIPGFVDVYCDNRNHCSKAVHSIVVNLYNITPQDVIDELQNREQYWVADGDKLYCSYWCQEEANKCQ